MIRLGKGHRNRSGVREKNSVTGQVRQTTPLSWLVSQSAFLDGIHPSAAECGCRESGDPSNGGQRCERASECDRPRDRSPRGFETIPGRRWLVSGLLPSSQPSLPPSLPPAALLCVFHVIVCLFLGCLRLPPSRIVIRPGKPSPEDFSGWTI